VWWGGFRRLSKPDGEITTSGGNRGELGYNSRPRRKGRPERRGEKRTTKCAMLGGTVYKTQQLVDSKKTSHPFHRFFLRGGSARYLHFLGRRRPGQKTYCEGKIREECRVEERKGIITSSGVTGRACQGQRRGGGKQIGERGERIRRLKGKVIYAGRKSSS